MEPEDQSLHERAKAIFLSALDVPAGKRRLFVAEQAGDDATLREQVMRLLTAVEGPEAFLREPTAISAPEGAGAAGGQGGEASGGAGRKRDASPTSDSSAPSTEAAERAANSALLDERPGQKIGPYKLLEMIGEGGFGRVFMAEQSQPVRRKVALKIIKLGMDTRQVVARFEQERQALALMDHPNIAKVLDGGATDSGRPYFVMELCTGEPITQFCDQQRLGISERLGLFVQVCRAVQHAHQKGLIHRDIKPSNVLVAVQDGKPFAKVIDFGIAKATQERLTERTLFTQHKQLIGTPEYMSPEQAQGSLDVDTRADVYSLGVLLYELLTGTTPFSGKELRSAALAEIERIIREVDPPAPSTQLSRNRETIERVAQRRNVEPARLGAMVRGELDWIVMKALEKDRARRYESPSTLASDLERYLNGEAVTAAPPSAAYRVSKWARRHRGAVAAGLLIAGAIIAGTAGTTIGLVRASAERDQARAAQADAEVVTTFLEKVLSSADPNAKGRDVTVRQIIDDAAKRIAPEIQARPRVEARVRTVIGRTYLSLGELADADKSIGKAEELSGKLSDREGETALRIDGVRGLHLFLAGKLAEAEAHLKATLARMDSRLGTEHEVTLDARNTLANVYAVMGKNKEASAILAFVADGFAKSRGPDSQETLSARGTLATVLSEMGEVERADELYRSLDQDMTRVLGADHPVTTTNLNNMAWAMQQRGTKAGHEEAVKITERVLEAHRRSLGPEHPVTIKAENNLAISLRALGRTSEAVELYERALRVGIRQQGLEHPDTAITMANLGRVYQELDKFDRAQPMLEQAEGLFRKLLPGNPQTAMTILGHGICLRRMGRAGDAVVKLTEAFELLEKLGPRAGSGARRAAQELAKAYEAMSNADEAKKWEATATKLAPPPR